MDTLWNDNEYVRYKLYRLKHFSPFFQTFVIFLLHVHFLITVLEIIIHVSLKTSQMFILGVLIYTFSGKQEFLNDLFFNYFHGVMTKVRVFYPIIVTHKLLILNCH